MSSLRLIPYLLLVACGASQAVPDVGPPQPQLLTEDQALLVIRETLMHEGAVAVAGWPLVVGERAMLEVDVQLTDRPFAIEWVSEADRKSHAEVLPQGTPDGPLRIITGKSKDTRTAQVLVLDANAYGYEANPRLVQRGAPGIGDAEARVRRDVAEFLLYARDTD
jgi:hypothetical protein